MKTLPPTTRHANPDMRFAFGRNWKSFLLTLDEHRIAEASKRLCESLGRDDLHGVRALDSDSGSGLPAVLLAVTDANVATHRKAFGAILESFVFAEISKLAGWEHDDCQLYHYRDKDQDEVDVVIENAMGHIVGVEAMAAATVSATDFRGLRKLARACDRRFRCGLVLYDGDTVLPFGKHLFAAPVACLWAAAKT